jgi:hypothetical protein
MVPARARSSTRPRSQAAAVFAVGAAKDAAAAAASFPPALLDQHAIDDPPTLTGQAAAIDDPTTPTGEGQAAAVASIPAAPLCGGRYLKGHDKIGFVLRNLVVNTEGGGPAREFAAGQGGQDLRLFLSNHKGRERSPAF